MVVDCVDVVYPSVLGYRAVPFQGSSAWIPFGSISTAWSIGKAVGALALQILIPDIIAFATQLNTLRWKIRIHQSEKPL